MIKNDHVLQACRKEFIDVLGQIETAILVS